MIDAIATSATADLLVYLIAGTTSATAAFVVSTFRRVKQLDRILLGEDEVEADRGVVGKVRELDERVERIEQRPPRRNDGAD